MRKISLSLNEQSIDRAISEVKAYQREVEQKCETLRRRVAEHIQWTAQQGFDTAIVSDVIHGEAPQSAVAVGLRDNGNVSIVFTAGDQAVFIEFGAGVYHNGAAGNSPHPWGAENGFLIGEYGQGKGKQNAWAYYPDGVKSNGVTITRGTPAAMPMYKGYRDAVRYIGDIAREVFG